MTSEVTIDLPSRHPGQARVIAEARRFNVLALGRRFGKTTLGLDVLVDGYEDSATGRRYPGLVDGGRWAWFAPSYKLLTEVWREAVRVLRPITSRANAAEHRIETVGSGLLEMWTLDGPDPARGRKYHGAVVDEAAMAARLAEAWNAAIRPTLADYEGCAWLLSTPKGRGFFFEAWARGQDPLSPDWMSWQMPTSANPFIKAAEVEAMRLSLPQRIFAQEVEAAFLDDAGGVFRRVMEAATATEQTTPLTGHAYAMGVDWGRSNDFTVLTVLDLTTSSVACVDRFNQIDYSVQLGRLRALAGRFGVQTIIAETNSMGEPLVESLRRDRLPVVGFHTSGESKTAIIDALALAFEQGSISILPDPVVLAELQAYEATRLPSGRFRYSAPDGLHDDTVMSLALAWSATTAPRRRFAALASPRP